jgi:hypothetical protein
MPSANASRMTRLTNDAPISSGLGSSRDEDQLLPIEQSDPTAGSGHC